MFNKLYLFIALATIISLGIAYFQYFFKAKKSSSTKLILFVLRSLSIFLLFLLLINPKIKKVKIETIKPSLVLLTDNSKSVTKLNQQNTVKNLVLKLKNNTELQTKFKIDNYTFSDDISFADSLDFQKNSTNISKSLQSIQKLYKKTNTPIVLITDGNQTFGNDYSHSNIKNTIYPFVVGDTTTYQDLNIAQLNVNKYAYLKHKFPVELFVNYNGNGVVASKLTITEGKTTVFSKKISLSKKNNAIKMDFFIPANKVGLHTYHARLSSIKDEKNILNNKRTFTVEVLNEQSKIVIVSDILHPDIAMFKRAIEHNKQRKVILKKPNSNLKFNDYQLIILYQPNKNFKNVFTQLKKDNKNSFIITGTKTDWNFLNNIQSNFNKKVLNSTEDFIPIYNSAYATFLTKDIGFENFQPLTDSFGKIAFNVPYQSLLFQQIGSVKSNNPLFVTFEQNGQRNAVLFGENAWRWRMNSKIESQSFEPFDSYINSVIQYLASNKKSTHLEIQNKKYYYQNETVQISAKVYDANYQFDSNVKLWISLTNKSTNKKIKYPFALINNEYEVKLADLSKGNYSFKVYDDAHKNTSYGHFSILDYNIEEQFTNANNKGLVKLALNTGGTVYYPNSLDQFIGKMVNDTRYKSIQKAKETQSPLIDWKWILGLIVLLLSVEWFIRKYKGYL